MTEFYTFKEFCEVLKANPNTVKTWRRRGNLPTKIFFKIGGSLYILKDKFEQWVIESKKEDEDFYDNI